MRKTILYLLLTIWFSSAFAQKQKLEDNFSVGEKSFIITPGFSYPSFDIGGAIWEKPFSKINPTINIGYRIPLPYNLNVKAFGDYTYFKGNEVGGRNANRDSLSFNSDVWRAGVRLEYNIIGNSTYSEKPFIINVFGGAGIAYSNSTVSNYVIWGTVKSPVVSPLIVIGSGYQYRLTKNLAIGIDLSCDYYFDDYIEGFYPRGGSKSNDYTYSAVFTFSYIFTHISYFKKKCRCDVD